MKRSLRANRVLPAGAVVFGVVLAWAGRFDMNEDGISYLDIADAYLRADWTTAFSPIWSPLYSWLLALSLSILRPKPHWELAVVQLTNLLIYIGAVAALAFCMRQLIRDHRKSFSVESSGEYTGLPQWALLAVGYGFFIYAAGNLIGISYVAPHMTVAALMYLATGLLLRIGLRAGTDPAGFFLLGIVLGLAYLARAQMLVLVVVLLGFAVLSRWGVARRKGFRWGPLVASAVFFAVASVYAAPLFMLRGAPAFGMLAKFNYATSVNRVPEMHWQGQPPRSGVPRHPTRRLFTRPEMYEFDGPVKGTYPPWSDPSYWYEGVTPRIRLKDHAVVLLTSVRFGSWIPGFGVWVLTLCYVWYRGSLSKSYPSRRMVVLALVVVALAMYLPVLRHPGRYIGPFLPLLWVDLLASVRVRVRERAMAVGLLIAVVVSLIFAAPATALTNVYSAVEDVVRRKGPFESHMQWQVADGLRRLGVREGAKVAVVGGASYAYWARLARVTIVAEVPPRAVGDFWTSTEQVRQVIAQRLSELSVEAIVFSPLPSQRHAAAPRVLSTEGWHRVGTTDYHVLVLSK